MNFVDAVPLVTHTGFRLTVRPTRSGDTGALTELFQHVTRDDLRFRFLTSLQGVSQERLAAMAEACDDRTDSLLALDEGGTPVAAAVLAGDEARQRGEVAIAIRSDYKGRGIGWTLLAHLVERARARGYALVESIEDRGNHSAIALEQEQGFAAEPLADDPMLVRVWRQLR